MTPQQAEMMVEASQITQDRLWIASGWTIATVLLAYLIWDKQRRKDEDRTEWEQHMESVRKQQAKSQRKIDRTVMSNGKTVSEVRYGQGHYQESMRDASAELYRRAEMTDQWPGHPDVNYVGTGPIAPAWYQTEPDGTIITEEPPAPTLFNWEENGADRLKADDDLENWKRSMHAQRVKRETPRRGY